MEFFCRARVNTAHLGILPGAFNPPTLAHLALASASLAVVNEVVFVLPRVFPHKHYAGASLEDRIAMLLELTVDCPAFSVAVSAGGLFAEIADECRAAYGEGVRLSFICGRDAAERIAEWDYGRPGVFDEMLRGFELLVAPRDGDYRPRPEWEEHIRALPVAEDVAAISSTEVREKIGRGQAWEHLVPPALREKVRALYGPATGPRLCSLPGT
jgi:nicotinate-nucleotide adenylyltransferase